MPTLPRSSRLFTLAKRTTPTPPFARGCAAVFAFVITISAAHLGAAETEVFRIAPPGDGKAGSGFGEGSAVRVEPPDNKSLILHLRDLPAHQFLKIDAEIDVAMTTGMEVEFLMMGGAEGGEIDPAKLERSRLQITVDGGKPVVDASFSGYMGIGGSFPDIEGHFLHLPGTGSAHGPVKVQAGAEGFMGFMGDFDMEKLKAMSHYRVTFVVPHTAPEAGVDFSWVAPKMGDDIFGGAVGIAAGGSSVPYSITSLKATVLDAPVAMDAEAFSQKYEALGGADAMGAMEALNDLVSAGHAVLPMLRERVEQKIDPELESKFHEAVASMDDPDFANRAAAADALGKLGNDIIPLARKTLAEQGDNLPVETKTTLQNLADRIENGSAATADLARANRVRRLLDTLGGDDVKAIEEQLPASKNVLSPEIGTMVEALQNMLGVGADFGVIPGEDAGPFDGPVEVPELEDDDFDIPID